MPQSGIKSPSLLRRQPPLGKGAFLGLLNKLLLTLGAGDGNLALAAGYTDGLPAAGTVIIPMLPVTEPLPETQIPPVLLVPLIGIPGEHTENGNAHQYIGKHSQHKIQNIKGQNHNKQAQNNTCCQNRHI